jgi:2-C-methyl-D-erythritol 4-phosphate cytidylyltransferase/2-C-methyl-D-erythritol 2,4-cyclodiphosphate synthase
MTEVFALIVAAGRGVRAGADAPKQYRVIAGKPLLAHTVDAFLAHPGVGRVVVVIGPQDASVYAESMGARLRDARLGPPVTGGDTRQQSVHAGLRALAGREHAPDEAIVLVHDGARPFLSGALIDRAIQGASAHGAVVPALAVTDTLKQVDEAGRIVATADRERLRAVQTPQAFRLGLLRQAHDAAAAAQSNAFTDDAAVCEWFGHPVMTIPGEEAAFKVTTPEDFDKATRRLTERRETRVATGYDVHAFGPGDHLWLAGVRIAHEQTLIGHSDADPVLHALTDALLGAIADGDIGTHFPPTDEKWRGAASHLFLSDAARRVRERGGRIVHLDATIICVAPKIGPHRDAMRAAIAAAAGIEIGRIGLKATTSERLGFTGRREGIATLATATVEVPA